MFDLGMVEGCGIPWLIWIQLLVSFLLLFVLFCFTLDHTDDDADSGATAAPATASDSTTRFHLYDIHQIQRDRHVTEDDSTATVVITSGLRRTQVGENLDIKDESVSCSSFEREEETTDEEDSSSPVLLLHPCQYFQLATLAFLKCFGLDSTPDPSSTCRRRKRKES